MRTSSLRTHLAQATQVSTTQPAYANGIRAAIATIGPIVIGTALGWHAASWMGLAGFNVALSDKGGPRRPRFAALLSTTFYGALAVVAGALLGREVWTAVFATALWALAAGLARSWGGNATTTGVVSLATFIVSVSTPAPTAVAALERGTAVLAGSAFAIVLAMYVWRVRPYRPVRLAVARVYRALAAGTGVREAIDDARMRIAALRRGLNAETPRGERLLVLVETADRLSATGAPPDVLERIAAAVETEENIDLPDQDGILAEAVTAVRELNDEQLRHPAPQIPFRRRYIDPLLTNLHWSSTVLRHALRVAIAAAIAQVVASSMHLDRGYWMTLSAIIILQPYTSATFQKGLQRAAGTIAGGLIAAALIALVHSPVGMLAIIFAGATLTVSMLPVNYGIYSLCLTPTFVLLADVGASDRHLAWLRVSHTLLGVAIAYFCAWFLWPASERGRVRDDLVVALRSLGEYTRCVGECNDRMAAESRRSALLALQNADTSLQRLLGDKATEEMEPLMAMLIYARRLGLGVSALAAKSPDRFREATRLREASIAIHGIAGAVEQNREPAPLAAGDQINGLSELHRAASRATGTSPRTAASTA